MTGLPDWIVTGVEKNAINGIGDAVGEDGSATSFTLE